MENFTFFTVYHDPENVNKSHKCNSFVGKKFWISVQCSGIYVDFLFAIQVSIYMLGNLLLQMKLAFFLFHGIKQFIHHIINNGHIRCFIVRNIVIRFAFSSLGKEVLL